MYVGVLYSAKLLVKVKILTSLRKWNRSRDGPIKALITRLGRPRHPAPPGAVCRGGTANFRTTCHCTDFTKCLSPMPIFIFYCRKLCISCKSSIYLDSSEIFKFCSWKSDWRGENLVPAASRKWNIVGIMSRFGRKKPGHARSILLAGFLLYKYFQNFYEFIPPQTQCVVEVVMGTVHNTSMINNSKLLSYYIMPLNPPKPNIHK